MSDDCIEIIVSPDPDEITYISPEDEIVDITIDEETVTITTECGQGPPGIPGQDGVPGADGQPGQGVPAGGLSGQQLAKIDGTDFNTTWVEPNYYQYIYNSSGIQSGNRFNNWANLITAIDSRKAIISFEQDETLPTGSWFHGNIQWSGTGQNPDQGAPVITLPTGFTFSNATNWIAENGLNIESTSTSPIYIQNIATTHFFDRCFIGTYNAPFFELTSNGLHAFGVSNGGQYQNYGYPIVQETTADPYGAIIVFTEQGIGPEFNDNTLATTNPQIVLNLKQSATLDDRVATYAGLNPAGVLQNQIFANASVIGFKNGNPTGITSDNVTDALSELEARIAILEAYH